MANIHEITLDVKKSGQTINEPIVVRTDDTDDVIRVHLKKDGQPYTDATSATFYGTKQDLTIIANDPATVEGGVITYSIPKELANISGKIKDAYFMIDGKITTENFVITVFKTVDFKGESKDYIPGLNSLIDKWNSTSKEWNTKLNGLDDDIKNLSMSDMLKQKMDKALADAETDYMTTFNKSVDNLNSVVSELSNKEDIATDKGKELDTAIDKVNQSIADVSAWLDDVQKEIITANDDFTKEQQKSVSDEIDKLKDSITSTQKTADGLVNQLNDIDSNIKAIDVPDLNAKVDSLDSQATDIKNKYDALKDQLDLATQNIGGVRTNLIVAKTIKNNSTFDTNGVIFGFNEGFTTDYIPAVASQKYTITIYGTTKPCVSRIAYYDSSKNIIKREHDETISTSSSEVITIPPEASYIRFSPDTPDKSGEYKNNFKLEKGPTATDYSLNPLDIATDGSIQTVITNALGNYSTTAEVDSKISTGVGQAKTYAEQSIKDIIGAAPDTLDTIAELADAVTKNKDGVQAINDGITKKADKSELTKFGLIPETISTADYEAKLAAGTLENKFYITSD
ncbi:phage tail protein [Companilactobacillus zhachilii]|uniref:phage tail protein n=1 Tax=Companilactobacillus zhachilii TaxID=2304606 RepID=UPI0040347DB7